VRVTIVAANTGAFDSRLRRTALALAEDGHEVTIVAWAAPDLPEEEQLPGPVTVRRVPLDLRLTSALRPLPQVVRRGIVRALGIDPAATQLPAGEPRGLDRLRAPFRRLVEILNHVRRVGPWRKAVLQVAPYTEVFHAKALIALPVIRSAAAWNNGRFVYDIADVHVEAARLARMPEPFRRLVGARERSWIQDAAGLTAVSDAVATFVSVRDRVPMPTVLMNTPPAWRPDATLRSLDDGRLRKAAGLPARRPIVLYQGGLSIDRGLEELIAALDAPALRDRDLAVVLLGYGRLLDLFRQVAAGKPGRLVVLDAVPPGDLLSYTAGAKIGYVGQPGRTLNQRLNLANKVFEYAMAGVPVIVDLGTEHCRLVRQEDLGRCADVSDPESVAAAIAGLLDVPARERTRLREHVRSTALTRYSWERTRDGLVNLYRELARDGRR
jgi:glycosyltransferase involved in cell wall biosynthesis